MRMSAVMALMMAAAASPATASDPLPSRDPLPAPVQLASSFEIFDSVLSPDGKWLVTGGSQLYSGNDLRQATRPALTLWDVEAGKVVRAGNLQSPYDMYDRGVGPRVVDLALGADGRTLLVYLDTRYVELFSFPELASQGAIDVKKSKFHGYRTGALSPGGAYLALGDQDGEIALWSVSERALVKAWKGHDKAVTHLAFAPGGATLASGGEEDTVRLWSVPKGKELREIDDLEGATLRLKFSPDGTLLAIGSGLKGSGGLVRVWSVPRKRFVAEKQCMVLFPVVRFAYSPDGQRLAYSCSTWLEKGTSLGRVIEAAGGKVVATLHHEVMTQDLVYLPDGQRLVTAQKQEINSSARREMNQSLAVWQLEPLRFLHYLHDPGARP